MKIDKSSYALQWDIDEERTYETGVSRGVLYPYDTENKKYGNGVVWNGLTQVQETPSGAEANAQYADDIKYLNLYSLEELGATIEAFTYPDAFMECDGSASLVNGVYAGQQGRKKFALCYTTRIGTEADEEAGYKLHIMYGCKASPSERAYATVNDSPEAITFSWEINTTPVAVKDHKDTSLVTIDSTVVAEGKMKAIEEKLFGKPAQEQEGGAETPAVPAELLLPDEIIAMING